MGPRKKNYITPQGFRKLQEEFSELFFVERPKVVETVAWAASNGDRSENGDYIYGKRRLRQIDSRLRHLRNRIESAEVVNPGDQQKGKVLFSATVTVELEDGEEKIYQIVGEDEIEPGKNLISWKSPVARALLGKEEGDDVTLVRPKGDIEASILKVEYIPQEMPKPFQPPTLPDIDGETE